MADKIRVVIADGHPIVREGLRIALERGDKIEVVAEAEDGYAAALAVNSQKPDVIILDSRLRKLECHDVVTRIRAQSAGTRILIAFLSQDMFEIQSLIEAGVGGFIAKTAMPQDYQSAVQALSGGGTYFAASLVTQLFSVRRAGRTGANIYGLTAREIDVLRLICSGFSNKDVARRFELSVRTVETHRLNIRKKTSADRLRDLIHVGRQLGVVEPEDNGHVPIDTMRDFQLLSVPA